MLSNVIARLFWSIETLALYVVPARLSFIVGKVVYVLFYIATDDELRVISPITIAFYLLSFLILWIKSD